MNTKLDVTLIIYGLALFSGISYLWGFWVNFDINILSYVALTDIVKASVYPALPAIAVLAFYSAMDGYNSMSKKKYDDYVEEGGFYKGFTYFVLFYGIAMTLLGLGNAIYILVIETGYLKLKGVYPLISIVLFLYIILSNKFLMKIPVNLRVFIVSIICFLPTYLFHKGYTNGVLAADHESAGFYIQGKGYCSSSEKEKFRYISVIGSKLFSYSSKDNSICITKAEDFRLIKYNVKPKVEEIVEKEVKPVS
jgi:hypothetical protein